MRNAKQEDRRWAANYSRTQIRNALKAQAVHQLGDCCKVCGYDRCLAALEFHHLDPGAKDFNISDALTARLSSLEIERELSRCVLLCATCHREVHAGLHPQYLAREEDVVDEWELLASQAGEEAVG